MIDKHAEAIVFAIRAFADDVADGRLIVTDFRASDWGAGRKIVVHAVTSPDVAKAAPKFSAS